MGVYIGAVKDDYSALQGPAPSGFHVPLITEWEGLQSIMNGLGLTTGDNWRINLHMPFAGHRNGTAVISDQNSRCTYWSSYPFNATSSKNIYMNSSYVGTSTGTRVSAYSVRCFKNSFETPMSSWTVINGTLGSAGIFWDQSEGLISITNGTTGYTIQDKNLGTTTVCSDGDTLSEANCGKYYQWGNNYGFAWTGSITTSSTKVDASNYGPGNYYSSSTFITASSNPRDWSNVRNDNLWGGVTGLMPTSLKNAYIGEYKPNIEYSYDFRSKSTTTLSNDGWTWNNAPSIDSRGIYYNSWSSNCWKELGRTIGDAKKITLEIGITINGGNYAVGGHIGILNSTLSGFYIDSYPSKQFSINGTVVYDNRNGNNSGTYTITAVYDLVNKTYNVSSYVSTSGSLTDAQIEAIRTYNSIRCMVANGGSRIQTVNLLVEY